MGGDSAYNNPLFMKTNYILLHVGVHILTAIWSWFAVRNGVGGISDYREQPGLLEWAATMWFQKWYPAKMAAESKQLNPLQNTYASKRVSIEPVLPFLGHKKWEAVYCAGGL